MSSNSLNTFMGVPDFLTLPPNNNMQQQVHNNDLQQNPFGHDYSGLNQSLALNTPSIGASHSNSNAFNSANPSYQNSVGATASNNVFDFFNVDNMQLGEQSNLQEWAWEGPSLFDMFDIVNPAVASSGQSGHT